MNKTIYTKAGYTNKKKINNEIKQLRIMLMSCKKTDCWCANSGTFTFSPTNCTEECKKIQNYFKAKPISS